VLNGRLALFDVDDTERLAAVALAAQLRRMGAHLREDDQEDALAFLVATIWEASLRYDPAHCSSFSRYAYQIARRRTVDFIRLRNGRTRWQSKDRLHERASPELVSLDGPGGSELASPVGASPFELADSRLDLARVFNN
jgi:DNA-directed RNA polymerase specialized sigma24 family protein